MRRTLFAILSLTFLLAGADSVSAQDGLPTVTIMQAGADRLADDVQFMMELSGPKGVKQWPVVRDVLPAFLGGVDGKQPMRVDILFGAKRDYRLSIPVGNLKAFHDNVFGFVGAKGRRIATGLYLYKGPAWTGYLRELDSLGYAALAEDKANVPANFKPLSEIQPLIDAGYDLAATVTNTADGADKRRKAIIELNDELLAALKKLPGESDIDLEIRRVGIVHQMQELERIFADSQNLTLGWTTDEVKKEGRLDLELTALEKSDLEASIKQLAAEPSLFSGIVRGENTIFFGRINHALDAMRQTHIAELLKLVEDRSVAEIAASADITVDHKEATTAAAKQFFKMLGDGNTMGVIDGFVDVTQADGTRAIAGAIRAADGNAAVDVLASLKSAGWNVEIDVAQAAAAPESTAEETGANAEDTAAKAKEADAKAAESDSKAAAADSKAAEADSKDDASNPPAAPAARFHKVTIPKTGEADFTQLFGDDSVMHVATTKDAIYYASGATGAERLKALIVATGADPEKNDGTFLETWGRVGPWIEYLKQRRERTDAKLDLSKLTKEGKTQRDENLEREAAAIDAFAAGKDTIHLKLQRVDSRVTGLTTFGEGILRFVGGQIAAFSEKTLQ